MALYKVLEKSYINNSIVEAGDTVEFDGEAGSNLELVEEVAKPKKGKAVPDAEPELA